jgi:hypothetical protein
MSAAASYDPGDRRALADAVVGAKQRVRVAFALNREHTHAAAMTSLELTPLHPARAGLPVQPAALARLAGHPVRAGYRSRPDDACVA